MDTVLRVNVYDEDNNPVQGAQISFKVKFRGEEKTIGPVEIQGSKDFPAELQISSELDSPFVDVISKYGENTATVRVDTRQQRNVIFTEKIAPRWSIGTLARKPFQFIFSFFESQRYLDILNNISSINLEDKTVIGSYRRWDEQTVNRLRDKVRLILRGLAENTTTRENFLIWAAPGSGKTFLIEEIARTQGCSIEFININFAKVTEEELLLSIKKIKDTIRPVLVLYDEVDARSSEDWLYENTFSLLDINSDSKKQAVFVLIGSTGGQMEKMIEGMRARHKGNDMVSRTPVELRFQIPPASEEDQLIIIASQISMNGLGRDVPIVEIEKLAAYYVLSDAQFKTPRHLGDLIGRAVRRVGPNQSRLRYDDLFESYDDARNKFWADHREIANLLQHKYIRIHN